MLASIWSNRVLIASLVGRDVMGRYQGSAIGLLWSLFNPVFMLMVYTFFFSVVFKARWPGASDSNTEFAMIAFAGLIVFNLFVECINRAPALVLGNVNFVKKVVFPLEVLPVVTMVSALFHTLISFGVWLVFYLVFFGIPHPTVVLLPLILIPLICTILGVSWFLASLGVYLRDVSQVISVITGALMFLSPIFYPVSSMPESFQAVIKLNPLTPAIEEARDLLVYGKGLSATAYLLELAISAGVAWLGFVWFQKTRKGFADVL
jgi:lipopolysaccharide transport system permease protein